MSSRKILLGVILLMGVALWLPFNSTDTPVAAQDGGDDEGCIDLYEDALQIVGTACAEMGRNEACYGHFALTAQLQAASDGQFETSGDIIDVIDIQSLETQPADPANGIWGVALLQLQADLPDDSDDTMTFILFGDVEFENMGLSDIGGSELQSFSLQTGNADNCEALPDGLMVRSPDGQRARVMINGVELTFSSTGFLTESDTGDLVIQGLEGEIGVAVDVQSEVADAGQPTLVTPGFYSSVPVTNSSPTGQPTDPEPVNADQQVFLPTLFDIGENLVENGIGPAGTARINIQSGTWLWSATVVESNCGGIGTSTEATANFTNISDADSTYARIGINAYTYSQFVDDPGIDRTYVLNFNSPTSATGYVIDHYTENDCTYRWESSYTAQ